MTVFVPPPARSLLPIDAAASLKDALYRDGMADINAYDSFGETLLHAAIRFNAPRCTAMLLKAGADKTLPTIEPDAEKMSPQLYAELKKHVGLNAHELSLAYEQDAIRNPEHYTRHSYNAIINMLETGTITQRGRHLHIGSKGALRRTIHEGEARFSEKIAAAEIDIADTLNPYGKGR